MGGAVLSTMDEHNAESMVPYPPMAPYKEMLARGVLRVVGEPDNDRSTPTYRSAIYGDETNEEMAHKYKTESYLSNLRRLAEERRNSYVMGYRKVEAVKKEEILDPITGKPKMMDITYFGETVRVTYGEVWERIESFGRGLAKLGIAPKSNIAIYQETCLEWFVTIYGIWNAGMTAATVFANLGEDALAYALHETAASAIVCGGANAKNIIKLINGGAVDSVPVIHIGSLPEGLSTTGITTYELNEVIALGRESSGLAEGEWGPEVIPDPDGIALIMYTSGTTGTPKGVMHSHGSLAAAAYGFGHAITDPMGPFEPGETHIAYLPMAHIMEFAITNAFIMRGAFIGFGTPRTLTDATARPHGDLKEYKPHFFAGVPRMYDTFKKAIEANLPEPGSVRRQVYDHAYESRLKAIKDGLDTPYWNKKVFATTRDLLGGRVRIHLTGSSPISKELQEFINVVFGPLISLYGMTETSCEGIITPTSEFHPLAGGLLERGNEFKLYDVEGYKHTDKPYPRGEICFRGPFMFRGYYKQPELTKEVMDEDGWYHTGDIGMITEGGRVAAIGRIKALVKNSLGEFIAIEALEAIYRNNKLLVPNGVCVLVHPNRNYICAVALTDETNALAFAKKEGIEGEWPAILEKPEFQAAAARSLVETARDAKRMPFEFVRHVRVLNDEWTVENDVLTAAQKLKRRVIDERYADIIAELFAEQ